MKTVQAFIALLIGLWAGIISLEAQPGKVGFYFAPEYSAMYLNDHLGNAIGYNLGLSFAKRKVKVGIRYYGRSGPINEQQAFSLQLTDNQTYKGNSVLQLGADHGYIGLALAYSCRFGNNRWLLEFPVSFGQVGAGFYLKDEDRKTPDGRLVSEWENELMDGMDASTGTALEAGFATYYQPFKNIPFLLIGGGLHFTKTFGWETLVGGTSFYDNKPRVAIGIMIQN